MCVVVPEAAPVLPDFVAWPDVATRPFDVGGRFFFAVPADFADECLALAPRLPTDTMMAWPGYTTRFFR